MYFNKNNIYEKLLFFSSILTITIFLIRFSNTISIFELKHLFSSGFEEESLLSIWYKIYNQNLYVDHLEYPYRWSIYNWLFYDLYSHFFIIIKKIFNIDFIWLPNTLRLLTFLGTIFIAITFLKSSLILNSKTKTNFHLIILVLFGLSFGYWNMTVRPDVLSLLFEAIAIYIFIKNLKKKQIFQIIIIALLLYISWSFKQTSLITLVSINIFWLFNKEFKKIFFLNLTYLSLVFITVFINNDFYLKSIYFFDTFYVFNIKIYLLNLSKIFIKNIFLIISFTIFIFIYFKNFKKKLFDLNFFLVVGSILSFIYILYVFTNAGSSENHSFIMLYYLSLLLINNEKIILENNNYKNILSCSLIIYIFACILILSNQLGRLSPKYYLEIQNYIKCINEKKLGNKIFIDSNYHSLPWITNYSNPTVTTYNYQFELKNNRLTDGGHEGLMVEGFFDNLILINPKKFNLEKYEKIDQCNKFKIYKLVDSLNNN